MTSQAMFVEMETADVSVTDQYVRVKDEKHDWLFVLDKSSGELTLNGRTIRKGTLEYCMYTQTIKKMMDEIRVSREPKT